MLLRALTRRCIGREWETVARRMNMSVNAWFARGKVIPLEKSKQSIPCAERVWCRDFFSPKRWKNNFQNV